MEQKYRIWNVDNKTMSYLSIEPFVMNEEDLVPPSLELIKKHLYPNQVLMESIGVQDESGREVYEGDIRRFKGWIGVVIFKENRPAIEIIGTQKFEWQPKEFFIDSIYISNIYEGE